MKDFDYLDSEYSHLYEGMESFTKIKKKKKKRHSQEYEESRVASLVFGSVWGIKDKQVRFDGKRKTDHYKDALRPCVILKTQIECYGSPQIYMAPGTSKPHIQNEETKYILKAKVPPENLRKTTWFLVDYAWLVPENNLQKRFSELTYESKKKLEEIIKRVNNEA